MQDSMDHGKQGRQDVEQSNSAAIRFLDEMQPTYSLASSGKHPIDEQYDSCSNDARSTSESVQCGNDAQQRWDAELNVAYRALQRSVGGSEEKSDALLQAQRQWLNYRDAEFKAVDKIYNDPANGHETRPWAAYSKMNIVKQRALELQERNGGDFAYKEDGTKEKHPVDKKASECEGLDIDCAARTGDLWDDELNKNYRTLRRNLDDSGDQILLNSERAWLKFRDLEFNLIDQLTDERYSGNRIEAQMSKNDIVRQRTLQLQREVELSTHTF